MLNHDSKLLKISKNARAKTDEIAEAMQVVNNYVAGLVDQLHKTNHLLPCEDESLRLLATQLQNLSQGFSASALYQKLELAFQAYLRKKEK